MIKLGYTNLLIMCLSRLNFKILIIEGNLMAAYFRNMEIIYMNE